jgi:hypothetical protein
LSKDFENLFIQNFSKVTKKENVLYFENIKSLCTKLVDILTDLQLVITSKIGIERCRLSLGTKSLDWTSFDVKYNFTNSTNPKHDEHTYSNKKEFPFISPCSQRDSAIYYQSVEVLFYFKVIMDSLKLEYEKLKGMIVNRTARERHRLSFLTLSILLLAFFENFFSLFINIIELILRSNDCSLVISHKTHFGDFMGLIFAFLKHITGVIQNNEFKRVMELCIVFISPKFSSGSNSNSNSGNTRSISLSDSTHYYSNIDKFIRYLNGQDTTEDKI